jgi:uncharacterized surface protein with fasciclin (FAS1) repeats
MKKLVFIISVAVLLTQVACNGKATNAPPENDAVPLVGQSGVVDDVSQKDVVKVAAGSADHTTLVAAVKQAQLVDALSNAGPFTVFAPTNEAFNKLPKGTVENLMKEENKAQLEDILQYHVYLGILNQNLLMDGSTFNQVNGGDISISNKNGKIIVNGTANIITSIPASNGVIHVIDAVLLPPSK